MSNLGNCCSPEWTGEEWRISRLWKGLAETGLEGEGCGTWAGPKLVMGCCGLGTPRLGIESWRLRFPR